MMKVLVTAANGNMARQVIPRLKKAGLEVRGMRATPGDDQALLAMGVTEVFVGDIREPEVIRQAVHGVDAIYHVCPGGLAYWERQIGDCLIEAALDEGVGHVVFSTLLHPIITDLLQHETKRDVEEKLVNSKLNWTILQPSDYMQTIVPPSTFKTGELPAIYSAEARQSAVDLNDVAEVAAKVLTEGEPHYWARYELSGLPQSFNTLELAEAIGKVCGKEIRVKPVSGTEYMRIWAGEEGPPIGSAHGMDHPEGRDFARKVLQAIVKWYASHDYMGNPNVLGWLLGRPPTSLEDYLRRLYQATSK
jgi:uncharacterized protein YbjT (DUF2867 family)